MIAAVIVAAGKGIRMGGGQPKQYLPLDNHPILVHTIKAFTHCPVIEKIILVAPEQDHEYCRKHILSCLEMEQPVTMAKGGRQRQASVFNGLAMIDDDARGIVLIHDGVRPLVSGELIEACIRGALDHGACIPVVPAADTLKQVDENGVIVRTVPRDDIYMAQTPQAFQIGLIKAAHARARVQGWEATDDASLLEHMGTRVHTIMGSHKNIKVTTPLDLVFCRALLKNETSGR